MREFLSPKRESHSGKKDMTDATDIAKATELIQEAFPEALGRVEQRITAAARKLGWSWSKAKKVWYGEAALIRAHQMAALEEAQIKEARRAHRQYIEKTARIAEFLERQDPDFHRPSIEGVRGVTGRVDRTGDKGD